MADVPDEAYTTGRTTYGNSASISWDGFDGIGTGNISVGIGFNAISKSGVTDTSTGTVSWTVNVNVKGQNIPDLAVYDLLVYGNSSSGFSLSQATGFPADMTSTDLTPRYDQKYIDGSFSGGSLTITVYPIYQDGVRVADLLKITGFSTAANNTYTYDSQIVNPNIYVGNTTSSVYNTAELFSANAKLNQATARVYYDSDILSKAMLTCDFTSDPAANVNNVTQDASSGFNYQDKSVVFRLSINADDMDLSSMTDASSQTLGYFTLSDVLPDGWEFMCFDDGSEYMVFEGIGQSNGTVLADDTTPDTVSGLSAEFNGSTVTFTFDSLSDSYVILVKAQPSDETVSSYFSQNQDTTITNTATLTAQNWTTGVTSSQSVKITSKILEKNIDVVETGELLWTVDYNPYNHIWA